MSTGRPSDIYGPGPVVHGPDVTHPGERWIVQYGATTASATRPEIASIPLAHQWFTGTKTGLICSWANQRIAEHKSLGDGVLLGQVAPLDVATLRQVLEQMPDDQVVVLLLDEHNRPLHGVMPAVDEEGEA